MTKMQLEVNKNVEIYFWNENKCSNATRFVSNRFVSVYNSIEMFSFDLRSKNPKRKNVEKGKKNENIDFGAPTLVWRET